MHYFDLVTPHDVTLAVEETETTSPILVGDNVAPLVHDLLLALGQNPAREGLQRTPERVARMFGELLSGYQTDLTSLVNGAVFESETQGVVTVRDIEFYSLCEHHLLPFYGKAHVAYIPTHKILGLSKIARLFEIYARRLQVQERLTTQVATTLMEEVEPMGVGVVVEAEHLCMRMRGVEKQNSLVVTSAMLGAFRSRLETREEFMTLIRANCR
jgi:GTP cyclohydrolase I